MANFKVLSVLVLWFTVSAAAQVSTANVAGIVEDSTDARIPGASIKLINSQTGTENDAITNELGVFLLSGVIPGNYVLQIERSGFATPQFTGITLNIGDAKQFLIRMRVGAVDQTVMVDASGMTLNATDASVSTVVDRKFVTNIPLNGRSLQDLISMTPGAVTQSPQGAGPGDYSVNGQGTDANSILVDGVSGNIQPGMPSGSRKVASTGRYAATTALGTTQALVSLDALQEFRVLSSTYSAEFGRTPGGQFSLVTRSGTSSLHGTAYGYVRNSIFDASDWFTQFHFVSTGESFHQQDEGGTLGGPLTLPGIYDGRDKTFFFASYERLGVSEPTAPLVQFVPDPWLSQDVPGPMQSVINDFPSWGGNVYQTGAPGRTGLTPFISVLISPPSHLESTGIRLDHSFSPRFTGFFRLSDSPSQSEARSLSSLSTIGVGVQTYTVGATAQLSATRSNDFKFGYATSASRLSTIIDGKYVAYLHSATDLGQDLGLPASYDSTRAEAYIRIAGIGESLIDTDRAASSLHQWNVRDTFNWQVAHHLFSFGIDERRIISSVQPPAVTIEADFLDRASMVDNRASDIVLTRNQPATPVFNEFAAFMQDNWRLSKRLSLAVGLRWEVDPPPGEAHGKNAYTLLGNIESPATLKLAPRGTPLWHTGWYNLAPRIGAAWAANDEPGREIIVRAGGGVFFDTANEPAVQAFNAIGFSKAVHLYNAPIPVTSSQLDFSTLPTSPYTNTTAFAFPSHLQLPYTLQWNVALEKALGRRQAFTLSYVGASSRRLMQAQRRNISLENPDFSEVYFFSGGISSNYQSLQAKFQRSISPGLQVLGSYVWSHTLDFGSTNPAFPLTYASSDLDIRHNLQTAVSWDEPKQSAGRIRENLLNGWGMDGRLFVRTAFPVTPLSARGVRCLPLFRARQP